MSDARLYRQQLALDDGTCSDLLIGVGALDTAASALGDWLGAGALFVLSTPRLRALHDSALAPLRELAPRVIELEVEDGEGAKTVAHAERLWRAMLDAGGKRDSRLIAFGGGTVGDLGGFVAGCFLRGIPYVQVPTTLLAQVDAAVGGKTAVDLPAGKNTVGLFHHPQAVVADTSLLATLPRAELRAGLMEVVKMAFVLDPPLLDAVEARLPALLDGDPHALAPVVDAAVAAKRAVVEDDPREGDRRRLLNFGHTLGHAIEAVLDYRGLRHGEAVGYGMLFALRLAVARGLEPAAAERLRTVIARVALPELPSLEVEALVGAMHNDKKATEAGLVWVLPRRLGAGYMTDAVPEADVAEALRSFLRDPLASF